MFSAGRRDGEVRAPVRDRREQRRQVVRAVAEEDPSAAPRGDVAEEGRVAVALDPATVTDTLGVLLKYQDDIERIAGEEATRLVGEAQQAA